MALLTFSTLISPSTGLCSAFFLIIILVLLSCLILSSFSCLVAVSFWLISSSTSGLLSSMFKHSSSPSSDNSKLVLSHSCLAFTNWPSQTSSSLLPPDSSTSINSSAVPILIVSVSISLTSMSPTILSTLSIMVAVPSQIWLSVLSTSQSQMLFLIPQNWLSQLSHLEIIPILSTPHLLLSLPLISQNSISNLFSPNLTPCVCP